MTSSVEGQIEFEHLHRYCIARDLCDGLDVLDVAAGEGYGSALLAGLARSVVGIEIDQASVDHAQASYAGANLRFLQGDALSLPLDNASVDAVVSFETLEHLADQARFVSEVRRVLRPGGLFLVSTPERTVYSAPGTDPNPYHVLELSEPEFADLLAGHFAASVVLRQRPILGSLVAGGQAGSWRSYERRSTEFIEATRGLARPHYLLGMASDGPLPRLGSSAYLDQRRVHDVVEAAAQLPASQALTDTYVRERDAAREELARLMVDLPAQHQSLVAEVQEKVATLTESLATERRAREAAEGALRRAQDAGEVALRRARDAGEVALRRAEALNELARREGRESAGAELALYRAEAHATLHAVQEARAAAEAHVAHLLALIRTMHDSMGWKLLGPLRWFDRRFPRLARTLSRTLKILWWTATLQIGHRAMQWRRHRAAVRLAAAAPAIEVEPAAPSPGPLAAPPAPAAPVLIAEPARTTRDLQAEFLADHGETPIVFAAVESPDVSIIIPAYRGLSDLETCLRSLAAHSEGQPSFEVVLIDDCPEAPVLDLVPDSPGLVKFANAANMGFLKTCNRGAAAARGRHLCFLNSDTIVQPGWLAFLVEALETMPEAGLVGGMLLNPDGTIQDAGWRILGDGWGKALGRNADAADGAYTYRRPVDCVTGACFVLRKADFEALNGFDELYAPAFYEEFDLAFRARARGMSVIYEPRSRVVHLGSASYGAEARDRLSAANHDKFVARFADTLRKHPWDGGDEFSLRHAAGEGPVLLVVDYGVPRPDRHAGDVTMSRYLGLMAAAGWRVVFSPMDGTADGPAAEALEAQGIELIRAPRTVEGWLEAHGKHVHAVWLARPDIGERLIPVVRAHTSAMLAYYTHDLHHQRLRREARLRDDPALDVEADRVEQQELAIFSAVDRVTTPSEAEAVTIRAMVPERDVIAIPPYFYEDAEIVVHDAAHFAERTDVVFVGGFPHTPNVDAALMLANELMPEIWLEQPEARLLLVGYAPPPEVKALAGPRIVVTGQVPAVEPYLANARVNLSPLRYGAGVKGKVVQALQNGVPVITTAVGAEGIGLQPGRDALIEETPAALVAATLGLLQDADRCASLSMAGAEVCRQHFSRSAARRAAVRMFDTPRCAVCGSPRLAPVAQGSDGREDAACLNCFALGRSQALARVVLGRLARRGEDCLAEWVRARPEVRIHEIGFLDGIADTLRGHSGYTRSAFPPAGGIPRTFGLDVADESIDLLISQDVMDHVADAAQGFAECARALRPGGVHVFTVPQDRRLRETTHQRVKTAAGGHRLQIGLDLPELVEKAGLRMTEHDIRIPGGPAELTLRVFEAVKP